VTDTLCLSRSVSLSCSLRKFKGTPNLRVVIGGGDGSINWVLSCMLAEGMTDVPAGCIPLGTGNDSSRAFGWGYKVSFFLPCRSGGVARHAGAGARRTLSTQLATLFG
jgi:diacylglycerol kinase family enzyme